MSDPIETEIGVIGNTYGCLWVKAEEGKYYWSIEDWCGHDWVEIPEGLYRALMEYEVKRKERARAEGEEDDEDEGEETEPSND